MYFRVRQKSSFLVQRDFYLFSSESENFLDTETNFPRVFHGTTVVQYILAAEQKNSNCYTIQ